MSMIRTKVLLHGGILFFVKYPEKGKVKSRLAADLDQSTAVILYRLFVEDTLQMLATMDYSLLICFYPPDALKRFQRWLGSTYYYVPQTGEDLGQRMKNCFTKAFQQGYDQAELVGHQFHR